MKNTHARSGRPDVLRVLADARPDELDPARLADSPRQHDDLARILAGATDSGAARSQEPRRLWVGIRPLGTVVAVAAVAASVVVVSTLDGQDPSGVRTSARPQSSAATPGSAASDGRADVQVDGRLELLSVAKKAETPAAEGTYWQTTTRSQDVNVVGAKGQLFVVRTTSRGSGRWVCVREPGA